MSTLEGKSTTASTSSFLTALVLNVVVFLVEIVLFSILRPKFQHVYAPRTKSIGDSERVEPIAPGLFSWPMAVFRSDPEEILRVNGMDAYFFVRFLRMMVRVFLPIWILSWIVLLPVTSAGANVGQPGTMGLDMFVFGNIIVPAGKARYAAQLILVYIFTAWILWNIRYEMARFVPARQRHLLSPDHARSVQGKTLLITGIPSKFLSVAALTNMYKNLPGGISRVWINHDLQDLPDLFERRAKACNKLESAETALLATATKLEAKRHKEGGKANGTAATTDPERDISVGEKFVPRNKRPSHRLPWKFLPFSLPFIGEKVDSIEWARKEIVESNRLLEVGRSSMGQPDPNTNEMEESHDHITGKFGKHKKTMYPPLNSAFITFNQQIAAHIAHNALAHHEPYRMTGRHLEVSPPDVIWSNLGLNPYEQKIRQLGGYAMTAALIIFWILPVTFVGIVSNVKTVCSTAVFLAWICQLPSVVVGIISGILPPVLLAVLTMLLPIILRKIAKFEGVPTKTGVELSLMTRFFIFQVIHNFLIVSFSSGIITTIPTIINDPTSIAGTLAANLPLASTFFLTYILLQGLSGTAGGFLQIVGLILYYVKLKFLSSTPRSVYNLKYGAKSVAWGTLFPMTTLLTTIALGYSIIAPIVNGLACAAFFLFYMMYKYLFTWVYEQPTTSQTGGLFFPKAISHIFVGLYVQLVCLAALFFLAQAYPEGALTIILIVLVVLFQLFINNSFGPLLTDLPLSLASLRNRDDERDAEQQPMLPAANGNGGLPRSRVGSTTSGTEKTRVSTDQRQRLPSTTSRTRQSIDTGGVNITINTPRSRQHAQDSDGLEPQSGNSPGTLASGAEHGFTHPAASLPQRTIWLPADQLGLHREEEAANHELGIDSRSTDAYMNEKGNVTVEAPPPGQQE